MSRTEVEKKKEERSHAETMVRLLGMDARVEDGDPPDYRPDMKLVFPGGRVIGVEHTLAIVQGIADGRMPIQRLRDETLAALAAEGLSAAISLRIPESLGTTLGNRKVRNREIEIVLSMVREALAIGGKVMFDDLRDIEDDDGNVIWPDRRRQARERTYRDVEGRGLRAVTAMFVVPNEVPGVMMSLPGTVHRSALIQAAIDDKAEKIAAYRARVPEVWLLVVGSSGTGGSMDVSAAEDGDFLSPFDRTIFLELFEQKCVTLRVRG